MRVGSCRIVAPVLTLLTATILVAPLRGAAAQPIPAGTAITSTNWERYRQYMPTGLQNLLAGDYFWKMPSDFKIVVGQTSDYAPSAPYLENTKKYSRLVRIEQLPDGGHTILGYVAGLPFPRPQPPMKGYKILVNNWYRYVPYLICGNHVMDYFQDRFANLTGQRYTEVYRRLSHISDTGQPLNDPRAQGIDYSEYLMALEPEHEKYTEILTLYYTDPARPEDVFFFMPKLRRVLRGSSSSRCAPVGGGDFTYDDFRAGFNGGITRFDAHYLRDQPVLTLVNGDLAQFGDLANYYPFFFPKPQVGRWEVRNSYVIDTRRIPSERAGYCYGKQIMYVDKRSFEILWKDLYNIELRLFKVDMVIHLASEVPDQGMQYETGNWIQTMWDIERSHLSSSITARGNSRGQVNNRLCRNVDGVNYDDVQRYSTVGGLTQVMR
jgi:hypothetical protein